MFNTYVQIYTGPNASLHDLKTLLSFTSSVKNKTTQKLSLQIVKYNKDDVKTKVISVERQSNGRLITIYITCTLQCECIFNTTEFLDFESSPRDKKKKVEDLQVLTAKQNSLPPFCINSFNTLYNQSYCATLPISKHSLLHCTNKHANRN